ncbi:FixH family protein [Streptomyces sp. NBC_00873]|uniref:transferase n=1 Tax=unclassified Streptomyces TaxID=2593676 RepID=UPI00386A8878|nr:FixH family protein [Streptomyces sp. NBC_00873]WTA43031.1 FixH family protein [Streptomyces sp. NBC_00842]
MTVPALRPTPPAESTAGCVADCIADADGRITFDLLRDRREGGASGAVLLLRLRGTKGRSDRAVEDVRLPLSPDGDGRLRAVLPGTAELAEGRWDAWVQQPGTDGETAVAPGIRDLRALVDRTPDPGGAVGGVVVRIPYPTADGRLAVRCWVRAPHAEAGPITFGPAAMTVDGTLYGAELGDDACVEARPAGRPERSCRAPVTGRDGSFSFSLPYDPPTAGPVTAPQLWELWLLPGGPSGSGTGRIRISRILDDIWDRKKIFVYPPRATTGDILAAPCYSADNDLCLRLEPARQHD